jgi:hypothetical protein
MVIFFIASIYLPVAIGFAGKKVQEGNASTNVSKTGKIFFIRQ